MVRGEKYEKYYSRFNKWKTAKIVWPPTLNEWRKDTIESIRTGFLCKEIKDEGHEKGGYEI